MIRILAFCLGVALTAGAAESEISERLSDAMAPSHVASPNWSLCVGPLPFGKTEHAPTGLKALRRLEARSEKNQTVWRDGEDARYFSLAGGRLVALPARAAGEERFAIVTYTIPTGAAGFYAITDSFLRRDARHPGQVDLRVFVRRGGVAEALQPAPCVNVSLGAGEVFDFDSFLGYLNDGDVVYVGLGPAGNADGDQAQIDFRVTRQPAIPVSVFPEDFSNPHALTAPGGWSVSHNVVDRVAARQLAWRSEVPAPNSSSTAANTRVRLYPGPDDKERAFVAAFRAPHSGYYAVHSAWMGAIEGQATAHWFVGTESIARRSIAVVGPARVSLNTDLGYVRRGDVIYLSLSSQIRDRPAVLEFAGAIEEWAPRRAPLRVGRTSDGDVEIFEPSAPLTAVRIASSAWISVPASSGDSTAALRQAFAQARSLQRGTDYVGIRLERGKTYRVGTEQTGGTLFGIRDSQRVVFDGNGATLNVASPGLLRREIELFSLINSRDVVLTDFTVTATSVPFTIGEILNVSPENASSQTVTFRVEPGALDPLMDLQRTGEAEAFAYDAAIPGRIAEGTWTHYPGDGNPSIKATNEPRVFEHRVRRTGGSIHPGQKWLIKNKGGGVAYLTTGAGTENVTLSRVVGRASGGVHLRFWQTSGINLLDCDFEPDGPNWISSSADSVHGRGREGVWIENTTMRGICEDIMNTYGENMVVVPDGDPSDRTMSIRMYQRHVDAAGVEALRLPQPDNVRVGEKLVFFNPNTGEILGNAAVERIENGRFTLSNAVEHVDPWEERDGNRATMVYNTAAAGRFVVRDSRFADSLRYGIYVKARGGVVFHTQFEGLSAAALGVHNEPEWPEGPPATHLWVQDCFFSQNNYGYQSKHRAFMTVDPAEISVYTRRLRDPLISGDDRRSPDEFRMHVTKGQYANSHLKFIGNTFHDWCGIGISVRNAHNVRIEKNLFFAPRADPELRCMLAHDPIFRRGDIGVFAGVYLDSVDGASVAGNRFVAFSENETSIVEGDGVSGVQLATNTHIATSPKPRVAFSFSEWFGSESMEATGVGRARDRIELGGAKHVLGRIGAGIKFDGTECAILQTSPDTADENETGFTIALWAKPTAPGRESKQVVYKRGDERAGLVLGIEKNRWVIGQWNGDRRSWLDLGPVTEDVWQHLAISLDVGRQQLRGYANGIELAAAPAEWTAAPRINPPDTFGSTDKSIPFLEGKELSPDEAGYHGLLDEFARFAGPLTPEEIAQLAFSF